MRSFAAKIFLELRDSTLLQCKMKRQNDRVNRIYKMKNQNPLFTDEMQLPIYDAIKNLPRWDGMPGFTQTRAQVLGAEGKNGAQADAARGGVKSRASVCK